MAASGDSSKPIIVAIFANFVIAVSKAIGYFFSGSSALLSETIHSIADVMNQSLLLIGIKRGNKVATDVYHYGYSQERFFWNLVSAMGIFILGCGVTVYHGVRDLLEHGHAKPAGFEQYVIETILVISMFVEGYSFLVAIKEIKGQAEKRKKKFFEYLKESTDPSVSAVFWEDFAAILGLLLALIGIITTNLTGDKTFDSIASILIGLLMGWIAIHLAIENKRFLLDRAIPDHELKQLIDILEKNEYIESFTDVKTIVFGPNRLKFKAEVSMNTEKLTKELLKDLNIKSINSESALIDFGKKLYAKKVSELEKVKKQFQEILPALQHVDFVII